MGIVFVDVVHVRVKKWYMNELIRCIFLFYGSIMTTPFLKAQS